MWSIGCRAGWTTHRAAENNARHEGLECLASAVIVSVYRPIERSHAIGANQIPNPCALQVMKTVSGLCTVRPWRDGDQHDLVRHANNRKVWLGLRDRFPHPYTLADAEQFLARAQAQTPLTVFAVAVEDRPVGGIGLVLGEDVERISAEIGYWLGEEFWGRGIATDAVRLLTGDAFATFELNRIFAVPYADNVASIRVLELPAGRRPVWQSQRLPIAYRIAPRAASTAERILFAGSFCRRRRSGSAD